MPDSLIEDSKLAVDMAYAEKPYQEEALAAQKKAGEALKMADLASDKVQRRHADKQKIDEGFETQVQFLLDRVSSSKDLPVEVSSLFESSSMKDKQGGGYQLLEGSPHPSHAKDKDKQFPASFIPTILNEIGEATVEIEEVYTTEGKPMEFRSPYMDYLSARFEGLPRLAIVVGIATVGNVSTRNMNDHKKPSLDQVFEREGSKVFAFEIIQVPARQ